MSYCSKCGAKIPESAKFCPNCGVPAPEPQPSQPQMPVSPTVKNANKENEDRWTIALVLCAVPPLGCMGIHRFYTGNIATGILMLLTGGGCGIWTLVDLIMIACNTFTDSEGNTLK